MPQFSRRHLQRNSAFGGVLTDVCAAGDERQAQFFGGALDKPFVGVTAAAPELVIEMGDGEPPAVVNGESGEQVQQHHGIQAAGHRHKNRFAPAKKSSRLNGIPHPFKEIAHPAMVKAMPGHGNPVFESHGGC